MDTSCPRRGHRAAYGCTRAHQALLAVTDGGLLRSERGGRSPLGANVPLYRAPQLQTVTEAGPGLTCQLKDSGAGKAGAVCCARVYPFCTETGPMSSYSLLLSKLRRWCRPCPRLVRVCSTQHDASHRGSAQQFTAGFRAGATLQQKSTNGRSQIYASP